MESIWEETAIRPSFESQKGDIKTGVLVIGAGISGILCAYMLKRAGLDCVVVEADRVCGGITKNTTAKITLSHGLIYQKLINMLGIDNARLYYQAHNEAMEEYKGLCKSVLCDYTREDSYVYSLCDREKIQREYDSLNKIGCPATFVEDLPIPLSTVGAVCIRDQAHFHPLKFAMSLAIGLTIYENTKVLKLIPEGALTNRGKITAQKVIVATHFPIFNKHGLYFMKQYQHRSYVIALKGMPALSGMYVDESDTGMSFRPYRDMILIGGGGHRTGKTGGNWQELSSFASLNYPTAYEVGRWATQDCMTLDGIPYIGRYSSNTPNLFVATGFNKWGMTSAMVAASVLADMVQGKENRYSDLFNPSRKPYMPQLALNALESAKGLFTPTRPRCPHLGCALKYNAAEHSWDCSCHGSRFSESGELIDNPATDDKKM